MSGEQFRVSNADPLNQMSPVSLAPLHLDRAEPFRRRHLVMKAAHLLRGRKSVVLRSRGRRPGAIRIAFAPL
ncbi:hypothetical protein ACVIHC_006839 [Bradyrhizobium diazoefficiens]